MNSANGMVNQIPFTPRRIGKRITPMMTRIKLLKTEISADTFPLEKAVNIAEAKILVTIQPPSKRIPFLGVFVNDM